MRADEATLLFDAVRVNAVVSVVAFVLAIAAFVVLGKRFRRQVQDGVVDPETPAASKPLTSAAATG